MFPENNTPKTALAHEFLVQYGGAEKTFEAICELFPVAPIYTAKYNKSFISKISPILRNRNVIAPKQNLSNSASKYLFTFMMAPVFENMDFKEFNLILSDGNTWNKGIIAKPEQLHITYIHTPPRFLYGYSTESTKRDKWYFKIPFSYVDNMLRIWDYVAAQRPDYLLVNSIEVQKRVQKFYKRDSTVIYPPVEVNFKANYEANNINKPYYIAVGRLTKYKNFDSIIEAFNLLGLPLIIVGTGEHEEALKKLAGENIKFVGSVQEEQKHKLIHNALGLINPVKDEDFGIVPVEAMGHGVPVLAHKSGGHLETIDESLNGMFFSSYKTEDLINSVKDFDEKVRKNKYNKEKIKASAQKYSKERFQKEYFEFVTQKWREFVGSNA